MLSPPVSSGFSKSSAAENAMVQVSSSVLVGVKIAASSPLSVQVLMSLKASVVSASVTS